MKTIVVTDETWLRLMQIKLNERKASIDEVIYDLIHLEDNQNKTAKGKTKEQKAEE